MAPGQEPRPVARRPQDAAAPRVRLPQGGEGLEPSVGIPSTNECPANLRRPRGRWARAATCSPTYDIICFLPPHCFACFPGLAPRNRSGAPGGCPPRGPSPLLIPRPPPRAVDVNPWGQARGADVPAGCPPASENMKTTFFANTAVSRYWRPLYSPPGIPGGENPAYPGY